MTTADLLLGRRVAAPPVHGVPAPQSQPLVRAMLTFRALLSVVVAATFVLPWRPSPLAWLAVLVVIVSGAALRVRRPLSQVAVEAALLPVVLLVGGLVDTRVLTVVPLPNPLDGYAVGTMSIVGAVWGWRAAMRLLVATVGVEAALAIAEAGVGIDTVVLLCQRSTWLAVAAAVTSHIGTRTAEAAAAVVAEAEGQERLTHLRALHDRAVQTLTAVVVGSASGWSRIRRAAPDVWQRIRADAAAERDRLQVAAAPEPSPAPDDVVSAVMGVVGRHRLRQAVELRTHGLPVVPERVAVAVARAVDEALTNVAKHAPGATATVSIDGAPGHVEVRVEDTGRTGRGGAVQLATVGGPAAAGEPAMAARSGSQLSAGAPVEGFGISQSLRGRLAAVGGRADVVSPPDAGTTVELSWHRPDPHPRPWPGAAGGLPRRARRGIMIAAVGWHLTASLSVLFVAWRLGWMVHPLLALLAVLVPAVLLLTCALRPSRSLPGDRMRPAIVPLLVLIGPVLVSLGGLVVRPEHLIRDYADPLTATAATTTAVVTFFAGPTLGAVALGTTSLALAVVAPLLNGYALADILAATTLERLVITFVAWFLFVRVGPLLSESVAARRRAAVVRARVAESTAISVRLVPVLSAIADAVQPDEAVRRQAFAALTWARLRLTGTAEPAGERVADALAAVAAWHPAVSRPPQIVHIADAPPAAIVSRAAQVLDVVLDTLDGLSTEGITVAAAGDASELRLTVAGRPGGPPPAGLPDRLRHLLAHRVRHVEVHDDAGALHVLAAVPSGTPAPTVRPAAAGV